MKLEPWNPDLRTLIARLDDEILDLQPDFQRGLAWNTTKQKRLIDTLLRGWSVPPLHILRLPGEMLAVLDGQQRLRAMNDFVKNKLRIGSFEPYDDRIAKFQGLRYNQLPIEVQRRIQNYVIHAYLLYEYDPDEPYELFFRLNLPTGLTQAEKRNALVGDSREQVKNLVALAKDVGWSAERIGFANTRLAYDDTIARASEYVESGSLRLNLTASELDKRYRAKGGFGERTEEIMAEAVRGVSTLLAESDGVRLNKATLVTWLVVFSRTVMNERLGHVDLGPILQQVEAGRVAVRRAHVTVDAILRSRVEALPRYLELYNDRASLRVTDVLSVVARDAIVWRIAAAEDESILRDPKIARLVEGLREAESGQPDEIEWRVLKKLEDPKIWGELS